MAHHSTLRVPVHKYACWLILVCLAQSMALLCAPCASAQAGSASTSTPTAIVRVDANPAHVLNSFDPDRSLGSSIDVLSRTGIDKVYSPHIVQESLSAGWGPITYRNNTELRMAAWHWTENGTWSDSAHRSGYFTGSTDLKEPIKYILAYSLPHRGFATSGDRPIQGPNLTYWKSNPYLTSKFTGESDALHFDEGPKGEWKVFPSGVLKNVRGGTVTVKLSDAPVSTRFLRILMTESSNTCDEHGLDDVR